MSGQTTVAIVAHWLGRKRRRTLLVAIAEGNELAAVVRAQHPNVFRQDIADRVSRWVDDTRVLVTETASDEARNYDSGLVQLQPSDVEQQLAILEYRLSRLREILSRL